ncbi:hypothetical protein GGI17_001687 [Coemansia sp. S146]|nr:hypothetical protein GGI17_001687 [Coemansia sp. S146]
MSVRMGTHDGGHGGPSAAAIAAAAVASHTGMTISNSTHWSTEETKLLIRTWGDHREEFAEIKRNLSVWNKVLERLLNAGFVRTVEQCRNRWKFLETKYKAAARDIGSAGCTAWEFFDDMDLAKYGTTHRRNSSSSSAGMHRHLYESPSQSPSQQNSVLSMSSSQQPAVAQPQHQTALFADPYGRMLLPPIRPGATTAPSMASTDSARSMRHGSPALPAAVSSSQHSRLYQPRQSSPSANYAYYHSLSSAASSCPTHLHPPSQPQYYEAVATSTPPPPPPPRRLSPLLPQRSPQKQQLRQQTKLHRPPAGRSLTSQIQQQLNLRHPASPSVTYSHHPLAAGHLPESHSSTPDSTSPASATIHARPSDKVNIGPGYPNQSHAPTASPMRQHLYPATLGHTAYSRASSGPAELRVPSTRIDSNIIHAKLAHGVTISSAQQPVSTLSPADKASAHHDRYEYHRHRTLSADDDSGRSHSEQGLRPSNERTQSDVRGDATDRATTAVHIDRRSSDSRPVSADVNPIDVSVSRKRKLQRTSMLLASNESEADHNGNEHGEGSATNDVELVGTISRADLLDFLREQSQQRQQRESLKAEERRRSEDIRREEEWRFHEYQMSLMQLIQHSLVPFAVDGDIDLEQIDVARAPPVVSSRNPGREEETESSADSIIAEPRATEPSAKPPAENILVGKANSAEEVEMQSRTPSPGTDDLGVSVSSPSLPQAEHSQA